MKSWECGVCGYVHKEETPPEKCPVCEAPEKMFKEVTPEKKEADKPPDKPPIAPEQIAGKESQAELAPVQAKVVEKRWRCTVCGYIHTGAEAPEKCPVCDAPKKMFVEIDADGKALAQVKTDTADAEKASGTAAGHKLSRSFFDRFAAASLKHHLHPISVHFPNGILPVAVLFLGLAMYFNIVSLETAAYYNLIFILATLPLVVLTGFIEWQRRYKGLKSAIFMMKITCSFIILVLLSILVFWRFIDPQVAAAGSPSRLIYLGISVLVLAVAGLAGYLGGKLLFGRRG